MIWPFAEMPRRLEPELMDAADLDPRLHLSALRGLARINAWSNSAGILWPPLARLAKKIPDRPLRILDVATGSGDLLRGLYRRARRAGISLQLEGCDVSPVALEHARARADAERLPIRFFNCDVLEDDLTKGHDAVVCSLFLHHLKETQAVDLLGRMKAATEHLVIVNDLQRSQFGLWLAYLGSRVLTRSQVVHVDAVRSVRAAFTVSEVNTLAERAGLQGAHVTRHWPWRFRLTWETHEADGNG